jgi:ARG and Rhodanese-Phosphatase-superfamily-associated Protein domain
MQTSLAPSTSLPFDLGEPRSFRGLTIVPLSAAEPRLDYVGLDEAAAGGLVVTELSEAGSVETLLVVNPLKTPVLLYEGEELVGAKQNRVLERSVLVAAGSKLEIPAKCVEQGRWAYRSAQFAPAPRAAYPELRRIRHDLGAPSQAAVWSEVAAKSARIGARSVTGAAEAMYVERRAAC